MEYSFKAKLWVYNFQDAASWYFITVPQKYTAEIQSLRDPTKKGFGSLKVTARIGTSTWNTSIFPDSKTNSYLLPIKKEIRSVNHLQTNDTVPVSFVLHIAGSDPTT